MMCNRCADLEEQVAFLKSELGVSRDVTKLANLRAAMGLTGNEGRLLLALHDAYPRVVPPWSLLDATKHYEDGEPGLNTIKVYVSKARKKLGAGFIQTDWGQGYRLSADAHQKIGAFLA